MVRIIYESLNILNHKHNIAFTRKQIKKLYYISALKNHPDKKNSDEKEHFTQLFCELQHANNYIISYMDYIDKNNNKNNSERKYLYSILTERKWQNINKTNINLQNPFSRKDNDNDNTNTNQIILSWKTIISQFLQFIKSNYDDTQSLVSILKEYTSDILNNEQQRSVLYNEFKNIFEDCKLSNMQNVLSMILPEFNNIIQKNVRFDTSRNTTKIFTDDIIKKNITVDVELSYCFKHKYIYYDIEHETQLFNITNIDDNSICKNIIKIPSWSVVFVNTVDDIEYSIFINKIYEPYIHFDDDNNMYISTNISFNLVKKQLLLLEESLQKQTNHTDTNITDIDTNRLYDKYDIQSICASNYDYIKENFLIYLIEEIELYILIPNEKLKITKKEYSIEYLNIGLYKPTYIDNNDDQYDYKKSIYKSNIHLNIKYIV